MESTEYTPRHRKPTPVLVTLACGCKAKCRAFPMAANAMYTCPSNMGHGYRVRWVSWYDSETGWGRVNTVTPA